MLEPLKQLSVGIIDQRAEKHALKLHVHSVQYAYKLASTRRALELTNKNFNDHGLDHGAASHPPDPHWFFFLFLLVEVIHDALAQGLSFLFIDFRIIFTTREVVPTMLFLLYSWQAI